MRRYICVALLTYVCGAWADQVTLKNGDRVTGSIVKKDAKTLTVKTDLLGTVTVEWAEVQNVVADKPVTVELKDGQTLLGTIAASQENTEIVAGTEKRQVPSGEVVALRDAAEQRQWERLRNPGFLELWIGTATLGFAGTKGNADTLTFTTGLNAARITRSDKTTLYFNAIKASASIDRISATTAQAVRGGWGYARNLTPRLFVNGFNDYDYDRFQNLDLRAVFGGGLGFAVWKGERGRFDLLGGGAWNHEKFGDSPTRTAFSRNSGEAYFGNEFDFRMNTTTSFFQRLRFFPNLTETGEYRANFDMGATTRLTRWLNWNIAISDRLLSNPVPGRQKNDFLYTTGIGVTFAR